PYPLNSWADLDEFSIRLNVVNWDRLRENADEYTLYFTINSPELLSRRFQRNLNVRILNNTAKTMEISFADNNPQVARDFVAAHAEEFIRYDLERRSRSDENILNFIDSQIDTVFFKLRDSETRLNSYKQENKISNLESISGVYLDRLAGLENEVIALEIEERLLSEVSQLTDTDEDEVEIYNLVPLVAGSQYESSLSPILASLYSLMLERQEALYQVKSDNNRIKNLNYQIDIQKNLVIETVEALKEKLQRRKENFSEKLGDVETTYYALPSKELEFARLKRLFTINEKYYTMLLEKRIEYQISKEGFVPRHQVLEAAILPSTPQSPKRKLVYAAFILAGLFFGFAMISIRYLLHNSITSLNEIVKLSNASISTLGVIPNYTEKIPVSMLIVDQHPKSLISEAFRSIRT
ncbi:MAG: hypothetical protein HKN32_04505, partial [Flavobacteriales bacterium]|nr:hypothetical protein [Flavobacteriales bacterium]